MIVQISRLIRWQPALARRGAPGWRQSPPTAQTNFGLQSREARDLHPWLEFTPATYVQNQNSNFQTDKVRSSLALIN